MLNPTALGFPLFDQDDDADIGAKLNAISNAVNDYLAGQSAYWHGSKTVAQDINDQSTTVVTGWSPFDAALDVLGITYGSGIFTFQKPGRYRIHGRLGYPTDTHGGTRVAEISLNDVLVDDDRFNPPNTSNPTAPAFAWTGRVAAGDKLKVLTYQSAGVKLALSVSPAFSHIHIDRIPFSS